MTGPGCPHQVLELAPVSQWGATPTWRCTGCGESNPVDCDHAQQAPTANGWVCIRCHRTLLGAPLEPVPASRR